MFFVNVVSDIFYLMFKFCFVLCLDKLELYGIFELYLYGIVRFKFFLFIFVLKFC